MDALQAAQNVIIELQYKDSASKGSGITNGQRSVYVGWTGMPSKRKAVSAISRGSVRGGAGREPEGNVVEIDATFGRTLGLVEGQKVRSGVPAMNQITKFR